MAQKVAEGIDQLFAQLRELTNALFACIKVNAEGDTSADEQEQRHDTHYVKEWPITAADDEGKKQVGKTTTSITYKPPERGCRCCLPHAYQTTTP